MSQFHELTVADIRRETPSAVSIALAVPDELREIFSFQPGQYLTLRAEIDGQAVRRPYSICSALGEPELRIAVKHVENGRFSSYANTDLAVGGAVDVMVPDGRFTVAVDASAAHEYVCIAAGSGITPILSVVRSVLEGELQSRIKLFYGNRDSANIIFREALEDLKDRYMARLELFHVLSRVQQDVALFDGRIDGERVRRFVDEGLIQPSQVDGFFLCGPGDLIETVSSALKSLGVDEQKINFERFAPADDAAPPAPPSQAVSEAIDKGVQVAVILDGARRSFPVNEPDDAILYAARKAGIELPYSCAGGMCCTCRCRVIEGDVEMAVNYSLQPWELQAGFALACQARPKTEKVVLDFDAI